jgi:hypothetical protein
VFKLLSKSGICEKEMSAKTGVAVHASNPTLQEAKAGGL